MSDQAASVICMMASEMANMVGWQATPGTMRQLSMHPKIALPERLPTREEAAMAARILLRCNGHDLDVWTEGEFPDDDDWLKALAKVTTPKS